MTQWTDDNAPRIWRCPDSNFYGDEPLDASQVYTNNVLSDIRSHDFNGIWLRGRLYALMESTVLSELNDAEREQRRQSVRDTIARGREHNVGVYLFFNEPLGLPADHRLWRKYPQLKGTLYHDPIHNQPLYAMCMSDSLARQFFQQAVESTLQALPGLAGVILITATEHLSHCWSHAFRYPLDDGVDHARDTEPNCPRCKTREPAEIVLGLLRTWRDAAHAYAPTCRVLAWNWSWSMWYPDPQKEIVAHLPQGIELMVDWERGGKQQRGDCHMKIDEYALSYPGPSERFTTSQGASPRGMPVHAKLQIGTTHEIATVPNLPLMASLHAKLAGLTRHGVAGTMACWNFGCSLTLNSYAVKQFLQSPQRYQQPDVFMHELARQYFGVDDSADICQAWRYFEQAFVNHYPFSIAFLYWSPVNDAPAHPLSLHYRAAPLGPSWQTHAFGDDPSTCIGGFAIGDVAQQLSRLAHLWNQGLPHYERAFADAPPAASPTQQTRRDQEWSCVRMIGRQMQSAANFFRFHHRRIELTGNANQPTTLPADEQLLAIMQDEIDNAVRALPLVKADPRLGVHQECHARMYDEPLIRAKIKAMQSELAE